MHRRAISFCVGCVLAIGAATGFFWATATPHQQRTHVISEGQLMLYNQAIGDIEADLGTDN